MATHKPIDIVELNGELTPSDSSHIWRVIHTKSRAEKKLADYALKNNICYYLPLFDSIKTYQYRKVKFTKPLFPGYIFIKASAEEMNSLFYSGAIASVIKIQNERELLSELNNIYSYRSKGAEFAIHEFIDKGIEVSITDGPLKGLTGLVLSHDELDKIILKVNMLSQAVQVTVAPSKVRVVK